MTWRDGRVAGTAYAAALAGSAAALGVVASRIAVGAGGALQDGALQDNAPQDSAGGRVPLAALRLAAVTAAGTWAVVGGRSLAREASAVESLLADGDLPGARRRLTHLVGRRTEHLDEAEIARAVIESVAENTSDAVIAPVFWGAVAGLPGLLAYRAVNTLDAMVGHHSPRYERFGWASARADDIANYVPARLTALLAGAVAPAVGGSGRAALAIARADGQRHPSPNAGVCESAYAGALGVRLGGRNDYGTRVEDRPVLGGPGKPATTADIGRAIRLSRGITAAAALACGALAVAAKVVAHPRT